MDSAYDVPDSTDWLDTPLKGFSELENALHCQICKEFYDTPMITSCNHTFCSKCIRTSLSSDGKCPACRTSDQANKLRNNWALQEVVTTFQAARPAALAVAKQAQEELEAPKRVGKRKRAVLESDDIAEAESLGRTTRSKSRRIAASQDSQPEPIEIDDSNDEDQEYGPEPPPDDGLVECPLGCGKRMKEVDVFSHLDKCEDEKKQARKSKAKTPLNGFGSASTPLGQSARPQDRINELNYSMMKEAALRKKVKDAGIPDWGAKQLVIQRHKEWVNIWNANCDSNHPRSKRELLHDLDVWERTQGGRAPNGNGLSSTIMKKDFDGEAYSKRHQDDFSRLIADAKRKKSNPAVEIKASKDDEDVGRQSLADGNADVKEPSGDERTNPYENNTEAISSVRAKVEALNRGESIEPILNESFKNPAVEDPPFKPGSSNACDFALPPSTQPAPSAIYGASVRPTVTTGEGGDVSQVTSLGNDFSPEKSVISLNRESSRDEHSAHERTGSPCDLATHITDPANTRKVPMFAVPSQPVRDLDGGLAGS